MLDRTRLAAVALGHRLPSMFAFREWADAGGLISYGLSLTGVYRLAAGYVDRIAKGANPAELPVQQPTKFELILNLKTAQSLGLMVRRSGTESIPPAESHTNFQLILAGLTCDTK